jgi:predicted MFS family arabinose efflux permease
VKAFAMARATATTGDSGHLRTLVFGVGFAQLYAWAALYYPFSVTSKLIAADLGLSTEKVFAGFSLLLLAGGIATPFAGRAIDRFGGRPVLALGSLAAAASLGFAASAQGPASYFLSCAALGISSALALYDAAFAAVVQAAGGQGRRAVTFVTFFGGFASTASWPVTSWLCDHWGWRTAYMAFAIGMLALNLPAYLAVLRRLPRAPEAAQDAGPPEPEHVLSAEARQRAKRIFAIAIAAHQFVISGLLIQLIYALKSAGLGMDQAIVVGMAFGPGQVLGRVLEMFWGRRFSALMVGRVAALGLPLGLALLLPNPAPFWLALIASLLLGMSNGLMTIARGVVPLALFGRRGYGAVIGDLGLVMLFARACGPVALAFGLARIGLRGSELAGVGVALVAVAAMEAVIRIERRDRAVHLSVAR